MPTVQVRVLGNRRATPTTRLLTIDLAGQRFPFRAGQWANLGLKAEEARPYSIASSPREAAEGGRLEFLIRVEGTGTELAPLRRGARVDLDGPHGRFCLPRSFVSGHALFVAGGTGIAPLRSMLRQVLTQRRHPECGVMYSARAADEFAFLRELRALSRQRRIRLALAVTRDLRAGWKGLSGRIRREHLEEFLGGLDSHAFICGPEGFVNDVRAALEELGIGRIRTEEQ